MPKPVMEFVLVSIGVNISLHQPLLQKFTAMSYVVVHLADWILLFPRIIRIRIVIDSFRCDN